MQHMATAAAVAPAFNFLSHLQANADEVKRKQKSCILMWMGGGPPTIDIWDLKPGSKNGGEFKPISTSVPGTQICELLPQIAKIMDRATLIRTYSHRYNSHNPYNVLTGYDGGNDRENYFAKRTDHPSIGSVCQYLDVGANDVPRYVMMPAFPGYTHALADRP